MGTNGKLSLTIDGKEVLAEEGMTILEAAKENGIHIPTLCHHPALSNWGGCRICVVEVDGSPRLAASCVTPVRAGMNVVTSNEKIIESRRTILEFLFAERNHNCMFCPQSGDCELQNLAYELQMDHLTVSFSFNEFPVDVTNEYMVLDHNRCILCGRCIRACQEIAGAHVLNFQNRGPQALVGFDLNEPRESSTCAECGVCMQVCPTGALYNRYRTHHAVKGHAKERETIPSFCPQCGLLCPTVSFVGENTLLKVEGELTGSDGRPDRGQLCHKGRFEVFKSGGKRLERPMILEKNGDWAAAGWEEAVKMASERLTSIREKAGAGALFGLTSSAVSNEELAFFRDLLVEGFGAGYVDTLDGRHFRTVTGAWKGIGEELKEASWKWIPDSDFVLIIGAEPRKSHPLASLLIRKSMKERGTKAAIVGETESVYPFISAYLPVKDAAQPFLIQGLLGEAAARLGNPGAAPTRVDIPKMMGRIGLDGDAEKIFHEVVEAFVTSENPLIIVGEQLIGLKDGSALKDTFKLALLRGLLPENTSRVIVLKPYGNSAGAWKLGIPSDNGPPEKAQWRGGLILLNGEDPLKAPVLGEVKGMDFVAVITPYFPHMPADGAQLLIPKPAWTEQDGTFASLDGNETAYKRKILSGPEGVKEGWQTLWALSDGIGYRPKFKGWDELSSKVKW